MRPTPRKRRPNVHKLFRKQSGFCWLCGTQMRIGDPRHALTATRDHVIPEALGGTWDPSNIRLAHRVCNLIRGSRVEVICLPPPVRPARHFRLLPLSAAWLLQHGYVK